MRYQILYEKINGYYGAKNVWKNTKESEYLTGIPKPHLSTSLTFDVKQRTNN